MAPKRRRASPNSLETANAKTDKIFIEEYLIPTAPGALPWITMWSHPRTGEKYSIDLRRAGNLDGHELKACFDLVAETSKHDYEASRGGWHPKRKMAEMKSADLRYILVKGEEGSLAGFTSFMPTYEEGRPVVYCYEIHLKPHLQGTGVGRLLMGFLFTVAKNIPPIGKVMLTCFLSNKRGLDFYHKLGFWEDEISPAPRKLRLGKTFIPDYVILSKRVLTEVAHQQRSNSRLSLPAVLPSSVRQEQLVRSTEGCINSDLPAVTTSNESAGAGNSDTKGDP